MKRPGRLCPLTGRVGLIDRIDPGQAALTDHARFDGVCARLFEHDIDPTVIGTGYIADGTLQRREAAGQAEDSLKISCD